MHVILIIYLGLGVGGQRVVDGVVLLGSFAAVVTVLGLGLVVWFYVLCLGVGIFLGVC